MAQLTDYSGNNYAIVNDSGRLLVDMSGIELTIGSVSAQVDSIYIQSGDNINITTGSIHLLSGTNYTNVVTGSIQPFNNPESPLAISGNVLITGSAHLESGTTYNNVIQETDPWIILGSTHLTSGTTYNIVSNVATNPIPVSGEVELFDGGTGPALIDSTTNVLTAIDIGHQEIHEGNHYFIASYTSIGSGLGSALLWEVTTPNTTQWTHLFYEIQGTKVTESRIYEGATLSGDTVVTPFNNNRNSNNTSNLVIKSQVTVSGTSPTSGTLLTSSSFGVDTGPSSKILAGGTASRGNELILKSGTTYLIEISSASTANLISYDAVWYEHQDVA